MTLVMHSRWVSVALVFALASAASACESPLGRPCSDLAECEDLENREFRYECSPHFAFTCQSVCQPCEEFGRCCPDGSRCPDSLVACPPASPVEPTDACAAGRNECPEGELCRVTTAGVRRCMADCRPEVRQACWFRGGSHACLPDPEAADRFVCWLGGTIQLGGACTSSYECHSPYACGRDGVCGRSCTDESECADHAPATACVNFVCVLPLAPGGGG